MAITKYVLTFPRTEIRIDENLLTFSIGKIKSRMPSVLYFKFNGYDLRGNLITEYTSNRWAITTEYSRQATTFELTFNTINNIQQTVADLDTFEIQLYLLGVDSENPLYFNELQLNKGEDTEYHQPNSAVKDVPIGFNHNNYANLYSGDNYLQIIRPYKDDITSNQLLRSQKTIIAPHLPNESEFDNAVALLYEYMYQKEQIIGVEK